ncbi:MAG: DNA alkylation repair protein [Planctomycetes bacterium]|nr:DNA alkylation repair protein [Planctomycetota bacterium]
MEAGVPLQDMFDRRAVALLGESFAAVAPGFDARAFARRANAGLDGLPLMARADHLADALFAHLPQDFDDAAPLLIAAMGPELQTTERNGLRVFFYLPHVRLIARHGVSRWDAGMRANHEVTRRFSAEFSIRPFLVAEQQKTLARLRQWTRDPNPHVRRLCSEGTRPRLPWASRLPALQADPTLALPILQALRDDDELYVRRSVANHLGDIAKDHPRFVFELCDRWLADIGKLSAPRQAARHWLIRHAVRHPARNGVKAAAVLRKAAGGAG